MNSYFSRIWMSRYFWTHLALSDLRSRWRRSFLGMFWSIVQPLGMTLLISIVFSKLFHTDIKLYAPYILSGIIVWDFVTSSVVGGSLAFVQADAYIKQCKHPLAIYTLRIVLSNLAVLALASITLACWAGVVLPQNFGLVWLSALIIYPILVMIAWPLSTLLAYAGTRFRDIPHALGLVMQAIWFVSPVYFEAKLFKNGDLHALIDYNPVYHLLQLVRAPLLEGKLPTLENIYFCLLTAAVFTVLAWLVGRSAERKVIFYL